MRPARRLAPGPRRVAGALTGWVPVVGLLAGLLAGCAPTFEIDVTNTTDRAVRIEMTQSVFLGEDTILASGTVDPGGARVFGPVDGLPIDAVNVTAAPEGNRFAYLASMRINPGRTAIVVERGYGEDVALRKIADRPGVDNTSRRD